MSYTVSSRVCKVCDGFQFGYCETCKFGGKMEELKIIVKKAMDEEKQRGIDAFGHFASTHEAWGVIEEEIMEVDTEHRAVKSALGSFKEGVRLNSRHITKKTAETILNRSILLACEAVQVGAMAMKYLDYCEAEEDD